MAQYNVLWDYDKNGEHSDFDSTSVANRVKAAFDANSAIAQGFVMWLLPREFRRHYAYNPIICRGYYCMITLTDPQKELQGSFQSATQTYYYYVVDSVPVDVEITIYGNTALTDVVARLTATTMRGCAVFNIAPAARVLLGKEPAKYVYANSEYRISTDVDNSVIVPFYLPNLAELSQYHPNTYLTYCLQNAVAQIGSDGDKSFGNIWYIFQDQRHLRINGNRLLKFDDYPDITLAVGAAHSGSLTLYGANDENDESVSFDGGTAKRVTADKEGRNIAIINDILDANGERFTVEVLNCPNEKIFPVRWRNRKGVLDYYTFVGTAYKIKDAKTTGVKDCYIEDGSFVNTNREPYAVEGSRKIKVGIDNATTKEIDLLTRLPYAPYVEWYDYNNEMWTRVTVSEFKNTEDMAMPSNYYEITFECPAINMQF